MVAVGVVTAVVEVVMVAVAGVEGIFFHTVVEHHLVDLRWSLFCSLLVRDDTALTQNRFSISALNSI